MVYGLVVYLMEIYRGRRRRRSHIEQRQQSVDTLRKSVGRGNSPFVAEIHHPVAVALKRPGCGGGVGQVDMQIYVQSAVVAITSAPADRKGEQLRVDVLAGPCYARGAVVVAPAHHRQVTAGRRRWIIGLQQAEKRIFAKYRIIF